ncbi:hypothetical protein RB195_016276 [Necator americanus]|uniref:Uncharacterized protein n=1 Tax=Necator americanus TaxID=51031 RepID=A0ABR1E8M0_NECAM
MNGSSSQINQNALLGAREAEMHHPEQSTLDGVIFVGLCVMCAAILLMVIKLCYNYARNFPVRKESEPSSELTTNMLSLKNSTTGVRYSVA